jgi:hypothetical protein
MIFRVWTAGLAATLASSAVAQPMVPLHLQCSGREPEWRLDAGPDAAQLTRADAKPVAETFRGTLLRLVSPQWDGAAWRGARRERARRGRAARRPGAGRLLPRDLRLRPRAGAWS